MVLELPDKSLGSSTVVGSPIDHTVSDKDIRLSALGLTSNHPQRPEPPIKIQHKKGCDDQLRFQICNHAFHWSETISFLLLVIALSLTFMYTYNKENSPPTVMWALCLIAAIYGNIVLWDISWIESDAEYSRLIHNACKDIEKENSKMTLEMERLQSNCIDQKILTTVAAQQTTDMAKQVGLVDSNGKLLNENMKKFEGLMDSPSFTGYHIRVKRVSTIQEESNYTDTRDNYYNDMIRAFKSATCGGDKSTLSLDNNRIRKRLKAAFKDYNNKCENCYSERIDVDKLSSMDSDGDSNVALWEFAVGIYKNVLQRKIGAEGQQIKDLESSCTLMRERIRAIEKHLSHFASKGM